MAYKNVYSQCNPPADAGEFNDLESLTDQLAYEPLSEIVARFMAHGSIPKRPEKADLNLTDKTTSDEVDACFEDLATEDVSRLDKRKNRVKSHSLREPGTRKRRTPNPWRLKNRRNRPFWLKKCYYRTGTVL